MYISQSTLVLIQHLSSGTKGSFSGPQGGAIDPASPFRHQGRLLTHSGRCGSNGSRLLRGGRGSLLNG